MSDIRIIPEGALEKLVKPIFDGLQELKETIIPQIILEMAELKEEIKKLKKMHEGS